MTQRTVSASWLKNLCDMFAAESVEVDALLHECGLHLNILREQMARLGFAPIYYQVSPKF